MCVCMLRACVCIIFNPIPHIIILYYYFSIIICPSPGRRFLVFVCNCSHGTKILYSNEIVGNKLFKTIHPENFK